MALVEVCGTKTYGKCMAAIFELLEAQEQRENLTSEVVVDIDLAFTLCCSVAILLTAKMPSPVKHSILSYSLFTA